MGQAGLVKGITTLIGGRQQRKFGKEEARLGEQQYKKQLADFRAGKFDAQVSGEMAKTRTDATRLAAEATRRASDRAGAQQQQLLAGAGRGDVRGLAAAAGQARQLELGAQQAQQAGAQTILGAQQEFGKYASGVQAKNESQRSQLEAMELARGAARFDAGRLTQQEGTQSAIEGTGKAVAGATGITLGSLMSAEKGGKIKAQPHKKYVVGGAIAVGGKVAMKAAGKAAAKAAAKKAAQEAAKRLAKEAAKETGKNVLKETGKTVAKETGKEASGLLSKFKAGNGNGKSKTLSNVVGKGGSSSDSFIPKDVMGNKGRGEVSGGSFLEREKTLPMEGVEKPEIKDPIHTDGADPKSTKEFEKDRKAKRREEFKKKLKKGLEKEKEGEGKKEKDEFEDRKPQDISNLLAILSAPSSNFARSVLRKEEDRDFMEKGGYVGKNGGVTEGEFSHKKNPIDMTNEDGEKVGEVTGGEYVFNEEQSSVMEELVRKNEPEMLIKFMRKLLSQPQFN
tara:strand:- start:59 stop:1582 length:1524 start_codon:yes stop_codon:yes gene_type:complete